MVMRKVEEIPEDSYLFEVEKYRIIKHLGMGTYGVVYQALNTETREKVAIKMIAKLDLDLSTDNINEIIIQAAINSPAVVRILDLLQTKDYILIVLELCHCDFHHYLLARTQEINDSEQKVKGKIVPIPERMVREILLQLQPAFQILDRENIIHRDLKLENILVYQTVPKLFLKICDFGISRKLGTLKSASTMCGTLAHMAPEIILRKKYSKKIDLWSIGVIIFELLTGEMPFRGDNIENDIIEGKYKTQLFTENALSEEAISIIKSLLEIDPEKRLDWQQYFDHSFFKTQLEEEKSELETETETVLTQNTNNQLQEEMMNHPSDFSANSESSNNTNEEPLHNFIFFFGESETITLYLYDLDTSIGYKIKLNAKFYYGCESVKFRTSIIYSGGSEIYVDKIIGFNEEKYVNYCFELVNPNFSTFLYKKTFIQKADMIFRKARHSLVTVKDKYVVSVGGFLGEKPIDKCEQFDYDKNEWKAIASLNQPRGKSSVCAFNDSVLYTVGGSVEKDEIDSIEKYDLDKPQNGWEMIEITYKLSNRKKYEIWFKRRSAGIIQIDSNHLLIFGGYSRKRKIKFLDKVLTFDTTTNLMYLLKNTTRKNETFSFNKPLLYKDKVYIFGCWNGDSIHIFQKKDKSFTLIKRVDWQ